MAENDHKRIVVQQFGKRSKEYVESRGHSRGPDLKRIIEWAHPEKHWNALDIATGGGHVARNLSPHVGLVIATDLTWQMLNAARDANLKAGRENIIYMTADAENLPFLNETFHMATCRIAPHHFTNKDAFISETCRTLKNDGKFIMIDNVVPADHELGVLMNTFEKMRDTSHAECASIEDWKSMMKRSGFEILKEEVEKKTYMFREWVARTAESLDQMQSTENFIKGMPQGAKDYFQVEIQDSRVVSLKVDQWMVMARKNNTGHSPESE
ncbi:MAG: methyltransferase domain-containing protein [Thermoplasmataceae archaeon]